MTQKLSSIYWATVAEGRIEYTFRLNIFSVTNISRYFPANTSIDLAKGLLSSDDSLFARLLQSIVREFGDENNKGEYCKARKVSIEFSPGSIAESSACVAAIACNETLFLFETKLVLILIVLHCSLSLVHDWVEHIQHSSAEIRSRFFQRENSLRVLSYAWQVSSS